MPDIRFVKIEEIAGHAQVEKISRVIAPAVFVLLNLTTQSCSPSPTGSALVLMLAMFPGLTSNSTNTGFSFRSRSRNPWVVFGCVVTCDVA